MRRLPLMVRAQLLRVLGAQPSARAEVIRQMHERAETRGVAELLIDLEAEPELRLRLMEVLQETVPPDSR